MHPTVRRSLSCAIAAAIWIFCSVLSPAQATTQQEEPTLVQRPTLSITTREVCWM